MNCLWLTRKYPRPTNSGELIYSNGLIRAFAATGTSLTVIAHDNDEQPVGDLSSHSLFTDEDGVEWRLGTPELGSRAVSLLTRYPSDSWRLKNGGPESALAHALSEESWDVIVIDHAAMGWAMELIENQRRKAGIQGDPIVVYVSHNHEAKIRREIARQSRDWFPKKWALSLDAEKYACQEESLCEAVDLVTAITETEVEAYREQFPHQRYLCLTPGYEHEAIRDREFSEGVPKRVVMSGSFEWVAKRINLERFLEKAAMPLAEAGIELKIVGKTEEGFRAAMSSKFPAVDFVGRVPEMSPHLIDARMGLIVEEFGGGFKLKTLEYVFHGLPLAGLSHAVDGVPLRHPDNILLAENTDALVEKIIETIDDFDALNRMSRSSLEICEAAFQWQDRGDSLRARIEEVRTERAV